MGLPSEAPHDLPLANWPGQAASLGGKGLGNRVVFSGRGAGAGRGFGGIAPAAAVAAAGRSGGRGSAPLAGHFFGYGRFYSCVEGLVGFLLGADFTGYPAFAGLEFTQQLGLVIALMIQQPPLLLVDAQQALFFTLLCFKRSDLRPQ